MERPGFDLADERYDLPSILISGASVAGPALALCLTLRGWDVTVVERADELRDEGQNVDVRGAGHEVARRLGIEAEIREQTTTEQGTIFVNADDEAVSTFDARTEDSPTAELEILRGSLSKILVDRSRSSVDYVFGDQIAEVRNVRDLVEVTFASGRREPYDVLAIAEGLRSRTRGLVFEPSSIEVRRLGVDIVYLTVPRIESDSPWWRWYSASKGRNVTLRPDNTGTTRATLAFLTDADDHDALDRRAQARMLRERFAGAGWQTERVLDHLDDAPLYYESLSQVRCESWSSGRVVMLGDAAHAPSPMAGLGTSLALVDAYVLAGELDQHRDDPTTAFTRFEKLVRPYVEDAQKLPPGVPRLAYPDSQLGVEILRLGTKIAAGPVGTLVSKLTPGNDDAFDLPDYQQPTGRPPR